MSPHAPRGSGGFRQYVVPRPLLMTAWTIFAGGDSAGYPRRVSSPKGIAAAVVSAGLACTLAACGAATTGTGSTPAAKVISATATPKAAPQGTTAASASPTAHSASASASASATPSASVTPGIQTGSGVVDPTFVNHYVSHITTKDPVVFITIDDGMVPDYQFLAYVQRTHLPVTVFLTTWVAKGKVYDYFTKLQAAGAVIEDHTQEHSALNRDTEAYRRIEICGAADIIKAKFGHRPTLLRPPYGGTSPAVLATAKYCGLHAVIGWNVVQDVTGGLQSSHGHHILKPGDIIIFHFLAGLNGRMQRVLAEIKVQHLRVGLLENYI